MKTLEISITKEADHYKGIYNIYEDWDIVEEGNTFEFATIKDVKEHIKTIFKGQRFSGGRTFIIN